MRWLLACACVLFAATTARADDLSATADKSLAFIGDGEPGCVVSVVHNGDAVLRRARGLANLDDRTPLTPASVFYIGSMSKQFTAMSIGLLIEDGKLSVDDDVRTWLPELPRYATPIRIRHLLHHSSGLREIHELIWYLGIADEDWLTSDAALELIARQRGLNFTPGTQVQYSNTAYFLLGLIVERASGKPLPQFAAERIFGPLGMTHTAFIGDHAAVIPHRAESYAREKTSHSNITDWRRKSSAQQLIGAGGMFTTVDDLARWDENFYTKKVGGASALKLLTTPGTLDDGRPVRLFFANMLYGAGIMLGPRAGHTSQHHDGFRLAYSSDMTRFPNEHVSVITLCNRGEHSPWSIAQPIVETLLPPGAPAPSLPPTRTLDPTRLAGFAGRYVSGTNARRFEIVDGQLMLMPWHEPLDAIDDSTFRKRNVSDLVYTFASDSRGTRVQISFPDAPPLLLARVTPPARLTLADYVGAYFSPEADLRTFIERGGKLYSRARLDEWEVLTSIGPDLFFDDDDGVLYSFRRDRSHAVSGVTASSGGAMGIEYLTTPLPKTRSHAAVKGRHRSPHENYRP